MAAYLGPFVVDTSHPMSEGLTLSGLVWAVPVQAAAEPPDDGETTAASTSAADDAPPRLGSQASSIRGRPVVAAGSEVLLADDSRPDGSHIITWRLTPDRSTLLQSPAFPVLVWNLLDWRSAQRPGVRPVNARPGVPVRIVAAAADYAELRQLDGGSGTGDAAATNQPPLRIDLDGRQGEVRPTRAGVYRVEVDGEVHRFAVQSGSSTESDLRGHRTVSVGRWDNERSVVREYRSLAWALGLAALALLGFHAWWVYRAPGGGTASQVSASDRRVVGTGSISSGGAA